jgi:signal transduction histidine kinase
MDSQFLVPLASSETAAAFMQAAITLALAGVCLLLHARYAKSYYLIWAGAWLLYALRLAAIISFLLTESSKWLYWHQVTTGWTALALLWAALVFSRNVKWRWEYALLIAYPVVWSYIAIYRMDNFLLAAAPAVAFLSIATVWTGWVFLQHHRRVGSSASLLLAFALLLWGLHHLDYPFLRGRGVWNPWGYYIDICFELAMGAGILLIVAEELQRGLHTLSELTSYLQAGGGETELTRALLGRAMSLPAVRGAAFFAGTAETGRVLQGAGACGGWEGRPPPEPASAAVDAALRTSQPVVRDDGARHGGAHAYVAALPVPRREGPSDALIVVGEARDPFAALDADFLLALGRQVGAALENAELYRRLEARSAELEHLAARMVHQHEEERGRLSRELHDETAQVFAAVNMQLGLIRETAGPDQAPRLDRALQLVGEGIRSIRSVTEHLRPPLLDDLGLVPALRGLIDDFIEHHAVDVAFVTPDTLPALAHDAEVALFRALQEALSNVARHANASRVEVRLVADHRGVVLTVRDDGVGTERAAGAQAKAPAGEAAGAGSVRTKLGGTGLNGMRERVQLLGGDVEARNADGGGFEVDVLLPSLGDDTP